VEEYLKECLPSFAVSLALNLSLLVSCGQRAATKTFSLACHCILRVNVRYMTHENITLG